MNKARLQKILLPPEKQDQVWELYHENSKIGRHFHSPPDEEVRRHMNEWHLSLPYEGYPIVELPKSPTPIKQSLAETIVSRISVRNLIPGPVSLKDLATMLYLSYGESRNNNNTEYPRPFRVVPSGGGLYPLEIFFHSAKVSGLKTAGIYHFNPTKHYLRFLSSGDKTEELANAVVYPDLIRRASLTIFITAMFERSVFKYQDRGYRFTLLEAGHVAQNLNLVSTALGLGSINIGGYFDREIDDLLGIDGVTHSTIYMIAIGRKN
jgi:SagB-type dehydrogenase family enzyme